MDTEQESAHEVNSEEENSPAAPAGIGLRNLSITSPVLYQQAPRLLLVQVTQTHCLPMLKVLGSILTQAMLRSGYVISATFNGHVIPATFSSLSLRPLLMLFSFACVCVRACVRARERERE